MTQIVRLINRYRVDIFWLNVPKSKIEMDFKPLITAFNMDDKRNWCFIHWQALPKGLRRWGIFYCNNEGNTNYIPFDWDMLLCNSEVKLATIQIDEMANAHTKPTAVILLENVSVIKQGEKVVISKLI